MAGVIDVLAFPELHLKPASDRGDGDFELSTPEGEVIAVVSADSRVRDHAAPIDRHATPRTAFEVRTPTGALLMTCVQSRGRGHRLRIEVALADGTTIGSVSGGGLSLLRRYRLTLDAPGDVVVGDLVSPATGRFDLLGPAEEDWGHTDVLARFLREADRPFEVTGAMTHEFALAFAPGAPARARLLTLAALLGWERIRLT
jgi:hypothetical protein